LTDKPETEFTGLESYVYEKIVNEDISWMPCHQAIIMQGSSLSVNNEAGNDILKKINEEVNSLCS
jgi:hypothetical protein